VQHVPHIILPHFTFINFSLNISLTQELEKRVALGETHAQHVQIDTTLKRDITNEEEEDDSSSSIVHEDAECDGGEKRSIEMTVALGDFDSNPIIPLLDSKDTSADQMDDLAEQEQDEPKEPKNTSFLNFVKSSNEGEAQLTGDTSSLLTARSTNRKKVLIEEINSA